MSAAGTEYRRANIQYVQMNENEVWSFILPLSKMVVAFATENGFAHATPVWFCVLDRRVYFRTQTNKIKLKLLNSGKICCLWEAGESYRELRGVMMWGMAKVVTSQTKFKRAAEALDSKYKRMFWNASEMPERWVQARRKEERKIVEVEPLKISSWDNRKV